MSEKFWATVFTVVVAVGGFVLKASGYLTPWLAVILVAVVGVAWIEAVYHDEKGKISEKEQAKAVKVYRAKHRYDTVGLDRMEPSAEWVRRWKAAGKPDVFRIDID